MSDDNVVYARASMLPAYNDCQRRAAAKQWRKMIQEAGYKLQEPRQSIGAATGQGCHTGAAYMLENRMDDGTTGNITECNDKVIDALHTECEYGVVFDGISPNMGTAEKQVLRQTAVYREHAMKIEPTAVEEPMDGKITFAMPDGEEIVMLLTGTIDGREPGKIRDLKTGRHRQNIAQYGAYSLLARTAGHDITQLVEDFLPRISIKQQQPPVQPHIYDVGKGEIYAYNVLRQIAKGVAEFRETGEPWAFPPNPMSMLCSDKYCPAWGTQFCTAHIEPE